MNRVIHAVATRLSAATLGCSAAMLFVVCHRRCVQILGPGTDSFRASAFVFLGALASGWVLCRPRQNWFAFTKTRCKQTLPLPSIKEDHIVPDGDGRRGSPQACCPLGAQALDSERGRAIVVAICALTVMGTTVACQHVAPLLNLVAAGLMPIRTSSTLNALFCVLVSASLEFLPTVGITLLLLSFSSLSPLNADNMRRSVGSSVYFYSLVGFIAGLLMTGKWFMPRWGMMATIATVLVLVAGVVVLWGFLRNPRQTFYMLPFLALAGLLIFGFGSGINDTYSYGQSRASFGLRETEFFRVGASADVRVLRTEGKLSLEVNGICVAAGDSSLAGEFSLACIPHLLRPSARDVLVVGLGSGIPSGVSLLFPSTRVICVEREPAMLPAARLFADVNYNPEKSRAFSLHFQDGRATIEAQARSQDLILLSSCDPRLGDTAGLVSEQFYCAAKAALSTDGILAHRLKLDSFSPAGLALIARTIGKVFPHCALARVSDCDAILLASRSPLVDSPEMVRRSQTEVDACPLIRAGLSRYFGTTNVGALLVAHLWLDSAGLRQLGRRDFEKNHISDWSWGVTSALRSVLPDKIENRALVDKLITASATLHGFEQNFDRCGCSNRDVDVCHQLGVVFAVNRQLGQSLNIIDWGLRREPEQPDLLADRLLWSHEEDIKTIEETVARIEMKSIKVATQVGVTLWERKQYPQAIVVFRRLTKLSPQSATLWCDLAMNYQAARELESARRCFTHASLLDPANDFVRESLRRFSQETLPASP